MGLCFLLQMTLFLPALAINAHRARANRYDFLCCLKSPVPHPLEEEKGCCLCCKCKSGKLPRRLGKFAEFITSKVGTTVTLSVFVALLVAGSVGCTRVYKDFKLEWFFPDDSYVNKFFSWNEEYFASGKPVTVYTRDMDYFSNQEKLQQLHSYLSSSKFVDEEDGISDWHNEFLLAAAANNSQWSQDLYSDGLFKSKDTYFTSLHDWMKNGGGTRYRTQVQWSDSRCGNMTGEGTCDPTRGITASRLSATLKLEYTNLGQVRYDTMVQMRSDIADIIDTAFPYSFEFLYWEEVGIIDVELIRNLAICGAVIVVMIGMMIPSPGIAVWVVLSIVLSVIDLVGFMYWWDVTISGVSTIYILISVGLAVDYSAHIAHIFAESVGTSRQRAIAALVRIGPSVFNAVVSTLLAVIVISFSKSYVFQVFFKALFLTVVLGGAHGLIFLPMMLSLFGGDKRLHPDSPRPVKPNAVADEGSTSIPMKTVTF